MVAAVDVGILNLTRYEAMPNPEDWYFGQRQVWVSKSATFTDA